MCTTVCLTTEQQQVTLGPHWISREITTHSFFHSDWKKLHKRHDFKRHVLIFSILNCRSAKHFIHASKHPKHQCHQNEKVFLSSCGLFRSKCFFTVAVSYCAAQECLKVFVKLVISVIHRERICIYVQYNVNVICAVIWSDLSCHETKKWKDNSST